MLKRFIVFCGLLLSACNDSTNAATSAPLDHPPPLQITKQQQKAFRIATTLLTDHHYNKQPLSKVANDIHNDFIQALDPNHLYFLQSDIDSFQKAQNSLSNARDGDLNLKEPVKIYQRYQQRAEAMNRWSLARLEKPLALNGKDSVYFPRRKELKTRPWFQSEAQAQAEQEKRLKDQLIRLMLGGKSEKEALKLLKTRYKSALRRLNEFSGMDLFNIYMHVIAHRFDPHTDYLSPRNTKDFNMNMSLQLEGIGAVLSADEDKISIRELIPGGPAAKSGKLHIKDQIIGVGQGKNGEMVDVIGWRLDKVVDIIRGTKGTDVRLLIEPANAAKGVHEVMITRDKIKLEDSAASANVEIIKAEGKTRKIGVIKLPSFYVDFAGMQQKKKDYRSTTRDVKRLLTDLKKQKVDGVVIDLRNNGGGSLSEVVQLAGLFIKTGPVVIVSQSSGNRAERDDDPSIFYDGPLGVLINHQSASASEIFAAAIQDYKRGIVIGSTSYGKGTIQTMMNLNNFLVNDQELGNLKFTVAMYHRITGGSTQLKGVEPDVSLPAVSDLDDVGERAENYALPWKQIRAESFHKLKGLSPEAIAKLQQQHQDRMQTNPALQRFGQYIAKMREKNQQQQWSLNFAARQKEFQDWKKYQEDYKAAQQKIVPPLKSDEKIKAKIDERNAAVEDEEEKEIFVPDVALYESLLIFADYLQLLRK